MYKKTMMEKLNNLKTRADEMREAAQIENRELTPDEAAELAEIRDDVKKIKETLGIMDDIDRACGVVNNKEKKMNQSALENKEVEKNEERAFDNFIRGTLNTRDDINLTPANNSAGYTIPTTIANKIIKKVYDICPILERSSKYNVKGHLDIPYYDDVTSTITVAYADEFAALSSNVGSFKKISLNGFLAGALVKISRSLINNSQFDIVNFVIDEMAASIARFIEKELLVGTPDKVEGLSTLTNSLTTAAVDEITADEVIKLQGKVKDVYQENAIWIMSSNTREAIRLLKDGVGRYLLQDDINAPFGKVLLGKPVYVSDNMPNIGPNNTVIYYGDMKGLATKFSEEVNIQVLRERYADEHADGVIGWLEFDSKVENAQMIAKLVCAVTSA